MLVQLEAIPYSFITSYMREEADPQPTTTSIQVVIESGKVSPEPPLLQTKQPQFPQLLLIRLALQIPYQFHCLFLDTPQVPFSQHLQDCCSNYCKIS